MTVYFDAVAIEVQLAYGAFMLLSGALVAGVGSWYLVRLLRPTGVLAAFPSGRDTAEPAT
jgi:energy-coupling factor transport system substrate-specific component